MRVPTHQSDDAWGHASWHHSLLARTKGRLQYDLKPGSKIKFIAKETTDKFYWALRIEHNDKGIQLFPESPDNFGAIEVYLDDQLIDTVA